MTQYEYHVSEQEHDLPALGKAGWELVAVLPSAHDSPQKFFLKRPLQSFRDQVTVDQKRRYYARLGIRPEGDPQ